RTDLRFAAMTVPLFEWDVGAALAAAALATPIRRSGSPQRIHRPLIRAPFVDVFPSAYAPSPRSDSPAARDSSARLSRSRSRWFARRTATAMSGAPTLPNPDGSPRFRSVIRVPPSALSSHV